MDAVDLYLDRLRRESPPPLSAATLQSARRGFDKVCAYLYPGAPEVAVREEHAGALRLRLYGPDAAKLVLFFHGGGFVMGSLDSHDGLCRDLAARSGAQVVSVDYRLAPEHPWPAAHDDAAAAFAWACGRAKSIVVMGDSAGGSLAATLGQGTPAPVSQVLLYPALDLTASTPSHREFAEGYGLDAASARFCFDAYAPKDRRADPAVSPGRTANLAHTAPAVIVIGGRDLLRDEGLDYAARLQAAGVPVQLIRHDRMVHGFVTMPKLFREAGEVLGELATRIREV